MKNTRKITQKLLHSSLIPLTVAGTFCVLMENLPQKMLQKQVLSTSDTDRAANLLLKSLERYLYFLAFVLVINVVAIGFKSFPPKSYFGESHQKVQNDMPTTKKSKSVQIFKSVMARALHYTLVFSFLRILWLLIGSSVFSSNIISMLDLSSFTSWQEKIQEENFPQVLQNDHQNHFYQIPNESLMRVLEEEEESNDYATMIPKSSTNAMASLSLAVGKVMSSLSLDACDIVLSKDESIAFVSIKVARSVYIIDITDSQSPTIMKTISLSYSGLTYPLRSLKLSSDEKYLFASTFQLLEVIDVTNLKFPKVLAQFQDMNAWQDNFSAYTGMIPSLYRISMAFSSDENTLFVAGIGLQIFDIKNKSDPILVNTTLTRNTGAFLLATSLEISKDKRTLFYVNETLNVFDIFPDPQNPRLISSYSSCLGSISSISFTKDSDTALITCLDKNKYAAIEKLDLSNPFEPKAVKIYNNLDTKVFSSLMILTMTSQTSHLFLLMDYPKDRISSQKLLVYDLLQEELLNNNKTLIPKATSLVFTKDNRNIIAAGQNQFFVLKLHLEYPNTETFSLTNNPISQFNTTREAVMLELFSEDKLLIILNDREMLLPSQLKLYNVSNTSAPSLLTSFDFSEAAHQAKLSFDRKKLYVVFRYHYAVFEIGNWSNITQLGALKDFGGDLFATGFELTMNGKTGFVTRILNRNNHMIDSINYTNLSAIHYIQEKPEEFYIEQGMRKLLIAKNDTILLMVSQNILVFNITDPGKITKLSTTSLIYDGATPSIGSIKLSADEKILLIISIDGNFFKLRIYNMKDIASPEFQSEFILPQLGSEAFYKAPPSFSADQKRIYILLKQSLLLLDISNLKKPQIAGVIPLTDNGEFVQFAFSADNKFVFIQNKQHVVKTFSLETQYTLFLHQEAFPLGQKYSDEVIFFKLSGNKKSRYLPMDKSEFRVLKVTTLNIKIDSTEASPQMVGAPFPYWMSFDKENSIITIEPRKLYYLGIYTLMTAFSNRVPIRAIEGILLEKNFNATVEDLVTTLISLGYLDNQLFLTTNFGSMENFFLTSQFSPIRSEIYNVLKSHYIETCTSFKIVPSLELVTLGSNKIQVVSPSLNSFKVEVSLHNNKTNAHALFVNRNYGSLRPLILEKKDRLIVEGSMKEIGMALQEIVVDLENMTSCAGTIVVSDHLNPPLTREYENISAYFEINGPPMVNPAEMSVQEQISFTPIFTGEYFTITLNESAFHDKYVNVFSYELVSQDKNKKVPTWLNFNHLNLKGTPPEELFERDFFFYLIVKNEFQQLKVPFRLHIKISAVYVIKLVMKLSPYILTLIGLTVSANKIYNVLFKNHYKHPKNFIVKVGEEISSNNNILPVLFVSEGRRYYKLLYRYLKGYVMRVLDVKSLSNERFVEYFLKEEEGGALDKVKIIREIEIMLNNLPAEGDQKRFRQYFVSPDTSKNLAIQLVVNQMIMLRIRQKDELETFKVFQKIKGDCIKSANWDPKSRSFNVDERQLIKLLDGEGMKTTFTSIDTSLLSKSSNINMDLLRSAVNACILQCQSVNLSATKAQVIVKQKVAANFVMTFLKHDLKEINVNSKFKVDYGINCQLKNDLLIFSGTVEPSFKGKNLVVQITTKRQKIMKELWIYEENCYWLVNDGSKDYVGDGETNVSLNSSGISSIQSYEVL